MTANPLTDFALTPIQVEEIATEALDIIVNLIGRRMPVEAPLGEEERSFSEYWSKMDVLAEQITARLQEITDIR